jgi:hypothetical protein
MAKGCGENKVHHSLKIKSDALNFGRPNQCISASLVHPFCRVMHLMAFDGVCSEKHHSGAILSASVHHFCIY